MPDALGLVGPTGRTVGFLLHQHFSYFLLSSLIVVSSLYLFDFYFLGDVALMSKKPSRGLNKCFVYTMEELREMVLAT